MIADLIPRLRTCPPEERRPIAIELGQTKADEAVTELIRIADEGEITSPKKFRKHWYSIFSTTLYEGSMSKAENQLTAFEALGETSSKRALAYVTQSGEWRIGEGSTEHCLGGWVGNGKFSITFPNIRGALKDSSFFSLREIYISDRQKELANEMESSSRRLSKSPSEYKTKAQLYKAWIRRIGGLEAYLEKYGEMCESYGKHVSCLGGGFNIEAYRIIKLAIEKLTATTITGGHKYVCYNVDKYPDMFDDAHRRPGYGETGDVTYVILHPYQPYDDDSMLLRWNSGKKHLGEKRWTMSFSLGIGGGVFPKGEGILTAGEYGERAGLSLLAHFGLMERRSEFHPATLGYMSPDELQALPGKPV